jgi:UDP-N-acetylmuramoylalanine--D-glutamate ligase
MVAPALSRKEPRLAGLRALVLGLGRSGLAAARLLASKDARVTVADRRASAELGKAAEEAAAAGALLLCGGHPPALADGADLIVVSPGVSADEPILARAREL